MEHYTAVAPNSGTRCSWLAWWRALAWSVAALGLTGVARAADYTALPAGAIRSALAGDADRDPTPVAAFAMRTTPVTRAEFAEFVRTHPQWQPGQVAKVFADRTYLQDWPDPTGTGLALGQSPVTHVSWFAAQAFCEADGARLPTWLEWEYAAAADATRTDARTDPQWLAKILGWYARPASTALPAVGGAANVYGVRDLHGLVWEWVDDFNALLVNPDSRSQEDADKFKFCGAGAINLKDRENYAVLMRIALLSSLDAATSTSSLGFRCVRPASP
jgi:formylglycine-generating enzyme required for sulfatase activity